MKNRKITKKLFRIVLLLFGMYLVCYLLLQLPAVQTFLVRKITENLSTSLGTKVSIERVQLKFFKTASLLDVYIEDQQQDTLLYARQLNASINFFSFFQKKLAINEIDFSNLQVNINRASDAKDFNFQFIIDHFISKDTTSKASWSIDLEKLKIFSGLLHFNDEKSGKMIHSDIGIFSVYLNELDLAGKTLDIEQIGLGDSYFTIVQNAISPPKDSVTQFSFPNTGWSFKIKQIRVDENELIYRVKDTEKQNYLNNRDLNLQNLSLSMDDFIWQKDSLHVSITESAFNDHSGFSLKNFAGNLTATPKEISLENLHLETPHSIINNNTNLTVSDFNKIQYFADSVYLVANFNNSKIDYLDLKLLIPNFDQTRYLNPDISEKIEINGSIEGYINDLRIDQLGIETKNLLTIQLEGTIRDLMHPDKTHFKVNLRQFNTSYDAIKKLSRNLHISPGFAPWDQLKIAGIFSGDFKNLKGRNVKLRTSSITRFEGDFDIKGIQNLEKAHFNVKVDDLRSISSELQGFSAAKLPAGLDSLGQFYYQGDFTGTIYDFALIGKLSSDAGSMRTDIKMDFDEKYRNAKYNGDLALDSFDLGKVLAIKDLGHLTMAINVFGSGLNSQVLRATVLGEVKELVYNNFIYHDLIIDGRFDKKQFAGHASIDDPNVAFEFEGLINLNDTLSRYRFRAAVDTLNFNALGFTTSNLGVSGYLESDFQGTFPDQIKGSVLGTKLRFSNLSDNYLIDSFLFLSDFSQQNRRTLEIQSDIVKANMEGDFTLEGISDYFYRYVDDHFPLVLQKRYADSSLLFHPDSSYLIKHQNFSFDIQLVHPDRLIHLVVPALTTLDTVKLSGVVNDDDQEVSANAYIHKLVYDGMSFGPATFTSTGNQQQLDHVLTISDVFITNGVTFPYIQLDLTMANDSALIGLLFEDHTEGVQEKLNLAALATSDGQQYQIKVNENMVLNNQNWAVNPDHEILYRDGKIQIRNLDFVNDDQLLQISTKEIQPYDDFRSTFSFDFKNFKLSEISELLEVKDAFYDGTVNGNLTLRSLENQINYLADLTLSNLSLQRERIGNLVIKSQQRSKDVLDILIRLDGGISGLDIRGNYNKTTGAVDLQGEIDQLEVKNLDPFFKKYITASEGKISGLIKVAGTMTAPVIDGNLELEKVATLINYLQARYTFVNEDIDIQQNKMTFKNFTLLDQNNNQAMINGVIDFKSLIDPTLNLKFKSSRFLVLNTPANSRDFFYGKLFVQADVEMTGSMTHPILQVNAKALDSTDFVLQPLVTQVDVKQEDFIIFANPNDYVSDTAISIQDLYKTARYNFDISANIESTPDAQLTIVIDPTTGDKLVCRGHGNIAIEVSPDGDTKILGNYIITQGQYAFNFQRVLKRTFIIDPGSRVNFVGDIFKSKFDISATYGVRTSTYELIKNQSTLNAVEESRSRQRSEVEVKLKLTGILEQPIAKFDIEIKEQSGVGVTSTVSSKIAQLREDESSMNKQVFGLLIFSSFIAEEQTTSSSLLADASQSVILSSVSNLLSNELNRLAKRYIKGVELDFGVDSYNTEVEKGSGLITELKVGLSKRLLNDRLTIKLGGNVQFENNDNVNLVNNQNSTFSGDFILEYKLSADGNYNIRFFQALSNEENIFSPGVNYSETGVSLFFTKSFNSKKYQLQLDE